MLLVQELAGKRFAGEWRAVEGSAYYQSPLLYKENGFKERKDAQALMDFLMDTPSVLAVVESLEKKKEKKKNYLPDIVACNILRRLWKICLRHMVLWKMSR